MHTTNNVPQSRCRAFLIYGELSEMGRWSKRRWRHAEGLHFSLFSPHKQEEPVSVCHNTHKTHSHTLLKDTSACTNMYHPHRLHQWHHFHRTHWFPVSPTLRPPLPFSPTAHNKPPSPLPTDTHAHNQKKRSPHHHRQPLARTHKAKILRARPDPIENAR